MMITVNQLKTKYRDILIANSALQAWCQQHYRRPLTIFMNVDEQNLPGEQDCPFIGFLESGVKSGEEAAVHTFKNAFMFGLVNDSKVRVGSVVAYTGAEDISTLYDLIWAGWVAGFAGSIALSAVDVTFESVEFFPLHLGGIDIEADVPATIGGDVEL